ncbi:ABC transporter related [Beutenbergia cavernae DSM 12333]|uniref:ABC transporter related n=1 Tax=Beutenbergia cavernae (strain ATCC BAA-8 / DSM 12333 / CCUG 43141 / JCM 11478 / NBRC 16432 / NCIMB 13614 / HKI 0122) TaxID=471853 RepID=C5C2B8_BEUC1|nr:ABC transporter ATP-binding protein [Beutenbergia cavernae]ACQ81743.1 ABC transporter related [Beutenbergia cavernae DSM 12333]
MSAGTATGSAAGDVLRVRDLRVWFDGAATPAVDGVTFDLEPGRCVALVGESGSGKSVTARTLLGLAGPGAHVTASELSLGGLDLRAGAPWRQIRGRRIGFVHQDALVALDPLRRVGEEVGDALRLHRGMSRTDRRRAATSLLEDLGVDDAANAVAVRAGELSGGQRQRALLASGLAAGPALLVADEPTSSLDAITQERLVELLGRLRDAGRGLLLITHDLPLVARLADDVVVLRAGRVQESGPAARVIGAPSSAYTRELLDAVGSLEPRAAGSARRATAAAAGATAAAGAPVVVEPVLSARGVTRSFRRGAGTIDALRGVDLDVAPGASLGVVGESGAGKTTLLRVLLGVTTPDSGSVTFLGRDWSGVPERARRDLRPLLGFVPQDVLGTVNPRHTAGQVLEGAIAAAPASRALGRRARAARVAELLDAVRLPAHVAGQRPAHLSGGQRQRIAVARALAGDPRVLLCDEPVSALDASVRGAVLDLLDDLRRERGVALVLVSHDLRAVARLADEIAVLEHGLLVERGPAEAVLRTPAHRYTQRLVAAFGG